MDHILSNVNKICFTFFSSLQEDYSNMKFIIEKLIVKIDFPINHSPLYFKNIYLSFHSPVEVPRKESFIEFPIYESLSINYKRIHENLNSLSHNCSYYGKDFQYKTRFDCYFKCMNNYQPKCLPYFVLFQSFVFSVPNYIPLKSYTKLNCTLGDLEKFELKIKLKYQSEICEKKCKRECYQQYFFIGSEPFQNVTRNLFTRQMKITIFNNFPTIIVNHLTEMTLISLLCNLGGLTGMWLGISIASTCNTIGHIMEISLDKLISYNFMYKIKILFNNYIRSPSYNFYFSNLRFENNIQFTLDLRDSLVHQKFFS